MTKWHIIQGKTRSAAANMQRDRDLLAGLQGNPIPVLHLYEWEGLSATYGHFVRLEKWFNTQKAAALGLQLARRPTGGGILFHTSDLAFSLTIPCDHPLYSPDPLESYQLVNGTVLAAIEAFLGHKPTLLPSDPISPDEASHHFCMAKPTIYDVMIGDRKVGGAAQRRTRWGYLHQGSVALTAPDNALLDLVPETVRAAMLSNSYSLGGDRAALAAALIDQVTR